MKLINMDILLKICYQMNYVKKSCISNSKILHSTNWICIQIKEIIVHPNMSTSSLQKVYQIGFRQKLLKKVDGIHILAIDYCWSKSQKLKR